MRYKESFHILSMTSVSFWFASSANEIVHPILKETRKNNSIAWWTRGNIRMKSLKLSKTSAYGNLGAIRDRHLHFCAVHLQTLLGPTGWNSGFHWPPKKTLPQICRKKWSGVQSFTGVALPLLEVYSISVELGPFCPGIKNCTVRVGLVFFLRAHPQWTVLVHISESAVEPLQKHWAP